MYPMDYIVIGVVLGIAGREGHAGNNEVTMGGNCGGGGSSSSGEV